MQRTPSRFAVLALWVAIAPALSGCDKKIVVYQVPSFWNSDLKTIAVVPFRNNSTGKDAGSIVADRLANALIANGTYKVYNRNDLKALMDEQDLKLALGGDASQMASAFKKAGNVQAILTGSVSTYAATSRSQRKQIPQYYYVKGVQRFGGYKTFTHTRNEANVATNATLISVSTGTAYHSASARWTAWAEGSPPKYDPYACTSSAVDNVAGQLVQQFAVVRKIVKVNESKALRICTEKYDGKWQEAKQVKSTDDRMFIVVSLPAACDRNRFRMVIVRKDQREDLAVFNITWSRRNDPKGQPFAFSPKAVAAAGGGPGQYEVKFYSGEEPVLRKTFHIR